MEEKLIYGRIASILKDTKAITKSERNQQQGFMFRGIDSVMNELHDLFARHEVFILQEVTGFTTENRLTKSGGTNTFTRATVRFRYMTTDGSYGETVNVGEAADAGDKGFNKAMSIALKYSLLQMFLIPTEEQKDPDAVTPEETDYLSMALQEIDGAQSRASLMTIYNSYRFLQQDARFIDALTQKKNALQ